MNAAFAAAPEADIEVFQDLASRHDVWLIPGSMFVRRDDGTFDQSIVLAPDGAAMLLYPVLTGTTDRDSDLSIVRATAAMSNCQVIDVNGPDAGGVGRPRTEPAAENTGHLGALGPLVPMAKRPLA